MADAAARSRLRVHRFRPRLLDDLRGYTVARFTHDAFAGLTVGVVALPLALAFAIASGVKPEMGLFTAVIAGFLISALGGSSVQIGGPAGAFIVIVYGIVQQHGIEGLLVSTVLAGVLLALLGWLRLGVLVRYVPVSVVIGFTNGIAVLIALSQLKDLLGIAVGKVDADAFSQVHALLTHAASFDPRSVALGLVTVAGLALWKRLGPLAARLPGPIVALVTLSVAVAALDWNVATIGSRFGEIPRALPSFAWPSVAWADLQRLFVPTVTIALLGAVESLLCARVADHASGTTRRHDPDQELMAQGVANIVTPFFGGLPATGTIARTMTNVRAGATSPVAGMVHAAVLLAIVLAAAPLAGRVPLAVLAGVLLFVAWNMGEWHEFARLRSFPPEYRAKLLGTFALTVLVDLTVAMQVGMAVACAAFVWRMARAFRIDPLADPAVGPGVALFRLRGALFFGATEKVDTLAEALPPGTHTVVLDAEDLLSVDASGMTALAGLAGSLGRRGVRLVLAGLPEDVAAMLARGGVLDAVGSGNVHPDRARALA